MHVAAYIVKDGEAQRNCIYLMFKNEYNFLRPNAVPHVIILGVIYYDKLATYIDYQK